MREIYENNTEIPIKIVETLSHQLKKMEEYAEQFKPIIPIIPKNDSLLDLLANRIIFTNIFTWLNRKKV